MDNNCFWCQTCQKKYFMSAETFACLPRSPIMKKPPFLDYDKTVDRRTDLKMESRKNIIKCAVCGHVMKEVENGGKQGSDFGS